MLNGSKEKAQREIKPSSGKPPSLSSASRVIFHIGLSWGWEALGLHEWPVHNLCLRFHPHLEAVWDHLGFGTTETRALPNPHFLSCFSPNTPQTILSLLTLLLHFHLCHENIHFKHIAGSQRNRPLWVRAMSHLDPYRLPSHALIARSLSQRSICPSHKIFSSTII